MKIANLTLMASLIGFFGN